MKTTREWYNELPNDIKIKALANTEWTTIDSNDASLSQALLTAFVWTDTPEGMEYWLKIYTDVVLNERKQEEPHTDDVKVNKIELASRIAHELLSTRYTAMGIIYEDEDMMETDGDMTRYREPYQERFDIEYCKVLTIIEEVTI
jgi:hypothetical protein